MHTSKGLEIAVGLFVALGLAALLMLAMQVSNLGGLGAANNYEIKGYFANVGGLKVKAPVKMSGVRIGRVSAIQFDQQRYEALVTMEIDAHYDQIPADSTASIYTAGLLGEQYIGLEPGADTLALAEGSELMLTQPAVILEQLIGQFLYQSAEGK